jgi:hypothetical protein
VKYLSRYVHSWYSTKTVHADRIKEKKRRKKIRKDKKERKKNKEYVNDNKKMKNT